MGSASADVAQEKSRKDAKSSSLTSSSSCLSTLSIESRFRSAWGFSWSDFRSWKSASTLMFSPRDPASLGIFRILFGLAMFHDVFLERHMSDLGASYSADRICH